MKVCLGAVGEPEPVRWGALDARTFSALGITGP